MPSLVSMVPVTAPLGAGFRAEAMRSMEAAPVSMLANTRRAVRTGLAQACKNTKAPAPGEGLREIHLGSRLGSVVRPVPAARRRRRRRVGVGTWRIGRTRIDQLAAAALDRQNERTTARTSCGDGDDLALEIAQLEIVPALPREPVAHHVARQALAAPALPRARA